MKVALEYVYQIRYRRDKEHRKMIRHLQRYMDKYFPKGETVEVTLNDLELSIYKEYDIRQMLIDHGYECFLNGHDLKVYIPEKLYMKPV